MLLGAGHGLAVFDLGDRHAGHALLALDVHHGVAEFQRDIKVVQALHDVALQPAGIRHQLGHAKHLGALQRHAAGHDQPDIAAAQNDHAAAGQVALHVDQALRRACGKDTRRAGAGDIQRAARTLAAAHGQHDRLGLHLKQTVGAVHGGDDLVGGQVHHHRVQLVGDALRLDLVGKAGGVFGAGQLLLKGMQTETVVDALVQNTAQLGVALQNQNILHARLPRGQCCGKPGRAAA